MIFLFLCSGAYSQSDLTQSATRAGEGRYQDLPFLKRQKIVNAKVTELKEGSLIVRLITFDSKIEYLKKKGKNKDAEKLTAAVKEFNIAIINEFKKEYDFSNVYFTYGRLLKKYIDNEETNIFFNDQLELDPNITLMGSKFILAAQASDRFYLYDFEWNRVPEPAPHAIFIEFDETKDISLDRLFEIIGGSSAYFADVYYFNDKLHKIHRRAMERNRRRR